MKKRLISILIGGLLLASTLFARNANAVSEDFVDPRFPEFRYIVPIVAPIYGSIYLKSNIFNSPTLSEILAFASPKDYDLEELKIKDPELEEGTPQLQMPITKEDGILSGDVGSMASMNIIGLPSDNPHPIYYRLKFFGGETEAYKIDYQNCLKEAEGQDLLGLECVINRRGDYIFYEAYRYGVKVVPVEPTEPDPTPEPTPYPDPSLPSPEEDTPPVDPTPQPNPGEASPEDQPAVPPTKNPEGDIVAPEQSGDAGSTLSAVSPDGSSTDQNTKESARIAKATNLIDSEQSVVKNTKTDEENDSNAISEAAMLPSILDPSIAASIASPDKTYAWWALWPVFLLLILAVVSFARSALKRFIRK